MTFKASARRMLPRAALAANPRGFVMPMVLIMMTTVMFVMLVVNQAVVANQRQITRYGYVLIARAAAKAAVDYAKEELESNLSYCGTPENRNNPVSDQNSTLLYGNTVYQVAYQVQVYDNVCTGSARNIRAIGRVYIPDVSTTAAYVQDIRVRLVQSGLYTESPGDFSPVAWYRSNVTSSVRREVINTGSNSFDTNSKHEEQTNGTVQSAACTASNNDLEFHTGNENVGEQRLGVTFGNIAIPRGATITEAYIQFRSRGINGTGGTSAQLSQPMTTRIWGFDAANKASFTCPGNNQLSSSSGLTSSVDWAMPAWNTQNQSSTAQQTPSLVSQVQTIVNRGDWNSGNNMGFRFQRVSGSGLRSASYTSANHTQLYVEWTIGGSTATATNGNTVVQWLDQTSNGNHLSLLNGNPLLRTNQLNGRQVIEFEATGDSPDLMGNLALNPAISNAGGMTVVAVMKPINTGASAGNDRYVTLLNSAQPNDTLNPAASGNVRAFMRNGLANNMTATANGYTPQILSSVIGSSFGSGSWGVYAFTISNAANERYSRNGSPSATFAAGNSNSFNVNQVLLGGSTSAASTYTLPGDMQIAELVVYDKVLSCSQLRLIENYYEQAANWNIASSNYNCPLQ